MGEFIRRVRDNGVAGPLRRTFAPDKWRAAFSETSSPDAADEDIFHAGLALHEKMTAIRSVLKLSDSVDVSATSKLRAFVAIVNYDLLVTKDKTEQASEQLLREKEAEPKERYTMEELTAVKLQLPGGFEWSPSEVVESLVDGIEIPIRIILKEEPDLAGNPRMNQIDWAEVAAELNLGISYRIAEDLWDDCLWNNYRMYDHGSTKAFLPQDLDVLRGYRAGMARRASLTMAFHMTAGRFQREVLRRGAKLKVREVCGIERQGKRQVIKISKPGIATDAMQEIALQSAYAAEPYYEALLAEPQETLEGLTLSALIDTWTVVSRASLILIESMRDKHARIIKSKSSDFSLSEYAPVLQTSALIDALVIAMGVSRRKGEQLVEFFTYRGRPGQEIWAQPLIPVGRDTVAPVFAAVTSPALRRLVDVWMRQAGMDLARRGPAFEAYIRAIAGNAIKKSKLLSAEAVCIEKDYTFKPFGDRDEQIDLIFSIGNTVFVAEAKCILEPTDAKSLAMHRKTVMDAAEQAQRKSKSLTDNRTEFVAEAKRFGMALTEKFKVIPLVILSTCTHVGVPAMGIPVIDEFILCRFLDGELEDVAIQPGDLSVQQRSRAIFYSNASEAEDRAPGYFTRPPQMHRFLSGLRERTIPIYRVSSLDWGGLMITLDCVPEGAPISHTEPFVTTAPQANLTQ